MSLSFLIGSSYVCFFKFTSRHQRVLLNMKKYILFSVAFLCAIVKADEYSASIRTPINRPAIGISIFSQQFTFGGLYQVGIQAPICLSAQVSESANLRASNESISKVRFDYYLGWILPGQTGIQTWQPSNRLPSEGNFGILTNGLNPYATNRTIDRDFLAGELTGERICFQLPAAAPTGFYSVFVWLVKAGKTPSDTSNWIAAAMSPLLIQDIQPTN